MADITKTRVWRLFNNNYKPSGIKSYCWLLRKYNFTPTKEGPFIRAPLVHTQGKFGPGVEPRSELGAALPRAIGGKTHILSSVLQKRDVESGSTVGEVTADDVQNDALYLSPVSIGTPGQTLQLDFDTGSSDLWVFSTQMPKSQQQGGGFGGRTKHEIFDPTKSSTFKKLEGYAWRIQYGDNSSASGTVGTDHVRLGGIDITAQAVELASNVSTEFTQTTGDGLLGLAWGQINTVQPRGVKTPVENMIAQSSIHASAQLFTAYLGSWRDANEKDQGRGFYTFGYIDQDVLKASGKNGAPATPYYTPVDNSKGFWEVQSPSFEVNGKTQATRGNTAIIDTGTTLVIVADAVCEAIYAAIPGARFDRTNQGWVYPARTKEAQLPVVKFAIGDKLFSVQKEDLGFADVGGGYVYGGIQSRGNLPFDILGGTWLKGNYAIFDVGKKQFGCLERVEQYQNLEVPGSG